MHLGCLSFAGLLLLLCAPSFGLPSGLYTTNEPFHGRNHLYGSEIGEDVQGRGFFDFFKKKPGAPIAPANCIGPPHIKDLLPGKTCAALGGASFREIGKDKKCLDRNQMRKLKDSKLGECWKPISVTRHPNDHVDQPQHPESAGEPRPSRGSASHDRPRLDVKPNGPRKPEKPAGQQRKPRPLPTPLPRPLPKLPAKQ